MAVSGDAFCWGSGSSGKLGNGSLEDRRRLAFVAGDLEFKTLSARGAHTCTRTPTGEVYCWGGNEQGQVPGSRNLRESTPIALPLQRRFRSISAGFANTYGLTEGGEIIGRSYGSPIVQ